MMKDLGAIELIASFIYSDNKNAYQVKLAALSWLAQLCFENETVSLLVAKKIYSGQSMLDMLFELMSASNTYQMQFSAAKCMTCIYRSKGIRSSDRRLLYRALPILIFLCKKGNESWLRAQAAEQLAYLIDTDSSLQKTASICDHLINSLADMLKKSNNNSNNNNTALANSLNSANEESRKSSISSDNVNVAPSSMSVDEPMDTTNNNQTSSTSPPSISDLVVKPTNKTSIVLEEDTGSKNELRQAAFKVFASLGANDETIRKRIIETENLMNEIMSGLEEANLKVKLAALRCLHSLSRSVQQLRTLFQDHAFWLPLRNLLQSQIYEIIMLSSAILCNLLLEFSPNKQVKH